MACGCNSSSGVSASSFTSSSGSPVCPVPRRTANPPTIPVRWQGSDRLRPVSCLKPIGVTGDGEVVVLDSPIDGVSLFDAATGNAFVGSPSITYVKDDFACAKSDVYGLPAYGAAPACDVPGQFPDRPLAFIRPSSSSTGSLFAHKRSCCAVPGKSPELTPVEISPDDLPSTVPADLWYLTCVVTEGTSCSPQTFKWYWSKGLFTSTSLQDFEDLPARSWTSDDNDTFGLAVWVAQPDGNWILEKIPDEDFQAYISKFVYRTAYLTPRTVIATQESPATYNQSFNVDLTTQPNYSADATEVQLWIQSNLVSPASDGAAWAFSVDVGGVRKYRSTGVPAAIGHLTTGEIHVPIPSNKILTIAFVKEIITAGTDEAGNASTVTVYLEAFK